MYPSINNRISCVVDNNLIFSPKAIEEIGEVCVAICIETNIKKIVNICSSTKFDSIEIFVNNRLKEIPKLFNTIKVSIMYYLENWDFNVTFNNNFNNKIKYLYDMLAITKFTDISIKPDTFLIILNVVLDYLKNKRMEYASYLFHNPPNNVSELFSNNFIILIDNIIEYVKTCTNKDYKENDMGYTPIERLSETFEKRKKEFEEFKDECFPKSNKQNIVPLKTNFLFIDSKIKELTTLLEKIEVPESLSEESYVIRTAYKDLEKLINSFLSLDADTKEKKEKEVIKILELMKEKILKFQSTVDEFKEKGLNVEIAFLMQKYNRI